MCMYANVADQDNKKKTNQDLFHHDRKITLFPHPSVVVSKKG